MNIPKSITILQDPTTPLEKALNEYHRRQSFHDVARFDAVLRAVRDEEQQKALVFWTTRCADTAQEIAHIYEGSALWCAEEGLPDSTERWYRDLAKVARRVEASIRALGGKRHA
jgi:hypothetical protein